jgi:ABC-type amino acid transport substrate-binding protein
LRNLELGTWDVLINLYHTEERATRFAFPKNHLAVSQYTLFALKNRVDIPNTVTLDQLKDLKVGLVEKASYGIKFDNVKDSLPDTFSGAPSEKTLFPMLLAGRLDIVPSDTIAGWFTLKNRTKKWKMVRTVKTDLFEKKKLFPVFTKKNLNYKQFISDWDASMNQMIVDGSLLELYNKHNVIYER